jgi:RND family efflux transporter MFP subunit
MTKFGWAALLAGVAAGLPSAVSAAAFDCLIEPSQVVELRTAVDGLIATVNVRRADPVRRGQVLVELQSRSERVAVDSARFRAQMEGQIVTAQNRIEYAKKKLARAEELQRENMVTAQARDEADAELRLAQSELKSAVENRDLARIEHQRAIEQLALRTLTSPFDGIVVDRLLNPGDLAESGSGRKPVLKVAQIDPLRVDVVLPASLFGKVRPGVRTVIAPQGSSSRYVANVQMVDRVVDAASATFVARIELPNKEGTVPIGVRCTAEFDSLPAAPGADKPRK